MASKEMEFAPSAIATASIVGTAVVGLAIGIGHADSLGLSSEYQSEADISSCPPRPKTSAVDTPANTSHADSSLSSNSDLQTLRNSTSRSRRNTTLRSSLFSRRQNNRSSQASEEVPSSRKESVSSRPSFLKRLSTLQTSQDSSPRSSFAPDSPALLNGSATPSMNSTETPAQILPNKLVKRAGPRQSTKVNASSPKDPLFLRRRPATSHQRTATLQQQFVSDRAIRSKPVSLSPFTFHPPQTNPFQLPCSQTSLSHSDRRYFAPLIQECTLDLSHRDMSKVDGSLQAFYAPIHIILPDPSILPLLITTNMVKPKNTTIPKDVGHMHESNAKNAQVSEEMSLVELDVNSLSTRKKPQRSITKHLSSPPSWKLRSGSIAKRQGLSRERSDDDENVPAEVTTSSHISPHQRVTVQCTLKNQMLMSRNIGDLEEASHTLGRPAKRNTLPTLPPLARVSSLSLDMEQRGSASLSPKPLQINSSMHDGTMPPMQYPVPNQSSESGSSPPASPTTQSGSHHAPDVLTSDRASTLVESDNETRGFNSGDDEETDFAETIFDSFRTATTGSVSIQNPLDIVFDTSSSQSKMTSFGRSTSRGSFHKDVHIAKVGDSMPVANQDASSFGDDLNSSIDHNLLVLSGHRFFPSPLVSPSVNEDFRGLCLEDDDDDEDWARDSEEANIRNSLSPLSRPAKLRHVSPTTRTAMFDLKNDAASSNHNHTPYSRLFQWSESQTEKKQYGDMLTRPKTEHGVQGSDSNSLRRRTPSFLMRSYSVPVVPDDVLSRPKTAKATEEWGDDFFEHSEDGPKIDIAINIPLSIQASQANILGHAQMIRRVKPVVLELKRLYNMAQEKKVLGEAHASLCDEAQGIIALTDNAEYSPIDKPSPSISPTSIQFDCDDIDEAFRDCGFEVSDGEHSYELLVREPEVTTTRRQSAFLPGDDIFGNPAEATITLEGVRSSQGLAPPRVDAKLIKPSTFPRINKDPASVARLVMEQMHTQRSISDPLHSEIIMSPGKLPFDTTSLKDLVARATSLCKTLTDVINASDCVSKSPVRLSPRPDSPAFTRVFTDHMATPPKRLPRSKSNLSNMSGSPHGSPNITHSTRAHVMKVL